MDYNLTFIEKDDLLNHIAETIQKYEGNLESWNLTKFNKNTIDPIKMVFDKTVNDFSWEKVIENEIYRQRDKSNTNAIGYFHQNIFRYIKHCEVPPAVWDVIYEPENEIEVAKGVKVKRIKVEMKNKHNTMNSASSADTFAKCLSEISDDPDCATFLVEAIASRSQNRKWIKTIDKKKIERDKIRRVSLDQFYAMVTGQEDAFYQLCMVLPDLVEYVFENSKDVIVEKDTVFDELIQLVDNKGDTMEQVLGMSLMMLGFNTYKGFEGT